MRDIDEVAKLINLPEDHVMGPMVAIGKGTKDPWPKPGQLSLDEVVLEDGFEYDGRHFKSLSAVAHEIAGTKWNGYMFFGLAKRDRREHNIAR